jgi:hypothetical protein
VNLALYEHTCIGEPQLRIQLGYFGGRLRNQPAFFDGSDPTKNAGLSKLVESPRARWEGKVGFLVGT